jgi:hypothetical protein
LFFNNLNFIRILPSSLISPREFYLSLIESREILPLFEEVEESRIVIDAFKVVPSGFRILFRISENY